jgi:hypothetical protein
MSELNSNLGRVAQLLEFGGPDTMGAEIITREKARGFKIVRPGDAAWFPVARWKARSIASLDGKRARLVALDAIVPGQGSLKAMIADIEKHGLIPVLVEPNRRLSNSLERWGWHRRLRGFSSDRETIWYPR